MRARFRLHFGRLNWGTCLAILKVNQARLGCPKSHERPFSALPVCLGSGAGAVIRSCVKVEVVFMTDDLLMSGTIDSGCRGRCGYGGWAPRPRGCQAPDRVGITSFFSPGGIEEVPAAPSVVHHACMQGLLAEIAGPARDRMLIAFFRRSENGCAFFSARFCMMRFCSATTRRFAAPGLPSHS